MPLERGFPLLERVTAEKVVAVVYSGNFEAVVCLGVDEVEVADLVTVHELERE